MKMSLQGHKIEDEEFERNQISVESLWNRSSEEDCCGRVEALGVPFSFLTKDL